MLLVFIIEVPLLLLFYICFSFKFIKLLLWILPIFLVGFGFYFFGDTFLQCLKIFWEYSFLWTLITLIIIYFLTRKFKTKQKLVIFLFSFCIVSFVSIYFAFKRFETPVMPFKSYEDFDSVVIYTNKGYKITLANDIKEEMISLFQEITVKKDLMEDARRINLDNSKTWYKLKIELIDNKTMEIIIFPNDSNNFSLMQVSVDGNISYYKAISKKDDLKVSWLNNTSSKIIHDMVISEYKEAFISLQNSFMANGTTFSFVVPEGLPDFYEIEIVGRPIDGAMVRFLKEINKEGFEVGKTYSFDVANYSAFRYLYLAIKTYDLEFDLINIYDYLPKEMQGEEAVEYYDDLNL